jgi:hypothetical protein
MFEIMISIIYNKGVSSFQEGEEDRAPVVSNSALSDETETNGEVFSYLCHLTFV